MCLRPKIFVNALRNLSMAIVVCISTSLPAIATPTIQDMWNSFGVSDISSNIISVLASIVTIGLSFVVWKYLVRIINQETHTPSGGYDTGHFQDEGYMSWLKTKEGASNSLNRPYWDESYQDYLNKDVK